MKKPARATKAVARNQALANGNPSQPKPRKFAFISFAWAVIGISSITIALCVAASATDVLQGHVRDEQKTSPAGRPDSTPRGGQAPVNEKVDKANSLSDKYGAVANSPTVAAAIAKAEALGGVEKLERAAGAKAAADREEALAHGQFLPGMDQTSILMHGFVPPGMSQEQAAMLSKGLPKLPVTPRSGPITPEMADRMAGMPSDPGAGLPGIQAENQQIYESYMRQRFGPVSLPPLHRDHGWLAQHVHRTATGFVVDHQMSLIEPQYAYDGGHGSVRELTDSSGNLVAAYGYDPYGRQTKLSGTGVDADFGYDGYYVHQRSGLNLAVHRAYSPSLGRWLSRDPIGEKGGTNLYAYVRNNPISYVDPLGLCQVPTTNNSFNCKDYCFRVCHGTLEPCYTDCYNQCVRGGGAGGNRLPQKQLTGVDPLNDQVVAAP
ncbi:MAG TPA: RHS repeat-associated core domain-containing protein [Oculatellaceae cyanobacterium]